ncbi:hypothetical protein CFL01nite_21820 [Corynebacterium flavescens]|uniref:Transposase n=1 Tax=Corynebacterium flavescens TaxID=28028 RepID=A0AB73BA83_CORFL|nr:hypothetical protein CFL01nite_21820 [Corynebacterium flavescens]
MDSYASLDHSQFTGTKRPPEPRELDPAPCAIKTLLQKPSTDRSTDTLALHYINPA